MPRWWWWRGIERWPPPGGWSFLHSGGGITADRSWNGIIVAIVGAQPRCIRRFPFVSRIAAGDTEKEGPAGPCGSWFTIREADRAALAQPMAGAEPRGPKARARGPDAAGRADGRQPSGRGVAGRLRLRELASGSPAQRGVRRSAILRWLRFTESRSAGTSAALAHLPGTPRDGIAYFVPAPKPAQFWM